MNPRLHPWYYTLYVWSKRFIYFSVLISVHFQIYTFETLTHFLFFFVRYILLSTLFYHLICNAVPFINMHSFKLKVVHPVLYQTRIHNFFFRPNLIINKLFGQLNLSSKIVVVTSKKYMYSLEDVESTSGLISIFTCNILVVCFFT